MTEPSHAKSLCQGEAAVNHFARPTMNGGPPASHELGQNYPNPFNPSTTIEYYLPRRSHVELTVHNLLGRKVATLVNQTQPHGPQMVTWNGKDNRGNTVASGVYLYRIKADGFTESRKMVLLK